MELTKAEIAENGRGLVTTPTSGPSFGIALGTAAVSTLRMPVSARTRKTA